MVSSAALKKALESKDDFYNHKEDAISLDDLENGEDSNPLTWAYRIILDDTEAKICEVYFDNQGNPTSWSESGSAYGWSDFSTGDALQQLKDSYEMMGDALESEIYMIVRDGEEEYLEVY